MFPKLSPPHRSTLLCSNVIKFIRQEIGEIVRYLPDKKISAASQTVAIARIAPKICQGQPPTMCSQCSRFNPNPFTLRQSNSQTSQHRFFCPVECFHNSPEAMLHFGRITSIMLHILGHLRAIATSGLLRGLSVRHVREPCKIH